MKICFPFIFFFVGLLLINAQEYQLASESTLTIEGTSTVHDWVVVANTIEGSLKTEGEASKEIDFQVVVADIKSERGATMDKKMHDALKSDSNPNVTFALTSVKNDSVLTGMLSIAGLEKEVDIISKVNSSDDEIKIVGEHLIVLEDFNIEPPTAMFGQVIVGDEITVKFDLVFEKTL